MTSNREYAAGALMAVIGAGAIYQGAEYGFGSLANMGSGFFPVVLGAGLVLLGGTMAVFRPRTPHTHIGQPPDWRGGLAITAAVGLFIALANTAGLAPAIFACVFAAALGTRNTTVRQAALLATCVMVFGVLLFSYGLKVQFPILRGVLR